MAAAATKAVGVPIKLLHEGEGHMVRAPRRAAPRDPASPLASLFVGATRRASARSAQVTIELKNGEIYRGHLDESEETMNCLVTDVVMTARDGRVTKLENVYIRGSQIKFMILPDLLKHSPVFEKVKELKKADDAKPRRGQKRK